MNFRIVSIGTLPAHPLWGERGRPRTGHATTTLIESGDRRILVDPSLPAVALKPRLEERCGHGPEKITHVFLTSFRPDLRRALNLFEHATWWISEQERETVGVSMIERLRQEPEVDVEGEEEADNETRRALEGEIALLQRCQAAPDQLAPHVDLFPLPGRTPGLCGLLLALPRWTALVCGDAVPTVEHLEHGQVLPDCHDLAAAQASFAEAVEIADLLIPGRDNLILNPVRGPF